MSLKSILAIIQKQETLKLLRQIFISNHSLDLFKIKFVKSLPEKINCDFIIAECNNRKEATLLLKNLPPQFPVIIISEKIKTSFTNQTDFINLDDLNGHLLIKIFSAYAGKEHIRKWKLIGTLENDLIWDWDIKSGMIEYNSSAWNQIFGVDEFNGKMPIDNWMALVSDIDNRKPFSFFKSKILNTETDVFEVEYQMCFNNRTVYMLEKGFIIRYPSGKAKNIIGITKNISQQIERAIEIERIYRDAHEKIKENEFKYRNLIKYSKMGLSVIYPQTQVVDILAGKEILGYSNEEYNKDINNRYIHPADIQKVREAYFAIVNDPEKTESLQYRAYKKNVGYIWIESTFLNMLNIPSVNGIVAHFRDINDRKIAEELTRLSEEKYRVLFNKNPLGLVVWDPHTFRVLEANEKACSEYGYKLEEFIGFDTRKLIQPQFLDRFLKYTRALLAGNNEPINYQSVNKSKSGSDLFIDITFRPFNYFGKSVSLAMIRNITEQVKLEEALNAEKSAKQREITEAVLQAQELERGHIGRELHDNINQILATSRLYIEYAQRNAEMHDNLLFKAKEFILTAIREVRNLSKSILTPSVIEVGLVGSLQDLLNSVKDISNLKFSEVYKVQENLLSAELKISIFRIVQEQLNNIIKHAKASKVMISISQDNNSLLIKVKDNGIGFSKHNSNSGLGLKNIGSRAALFNGTMEIISKPQKGTLLKVEFKLNKTV